MWGLVVRLYVDHAHSGIQTEFRQNYMTAWRQRKELSIHIFVDDEKLSVSIPVDGTDKAMLARIRSFYQMMLGPSCISLALPKLILVNTEFFISR